MNTSSVSLKNGLDDILRDLRCFRQNGDLGRLALLVYCDVRRWAREAGAQELASHSSALVNHFPHLAHDEFVAAIDELIAGLEQARFRTATSHCRL
ncbi:MAG: hypothetical protein ACWA6Y_03200 [Polaromonas sp.]